MHFCATPFYLPHFPDRISSTDRSRNLGAAIWKHEGRETSTLIAIHLRLMCAAGGWCFPSPQSPLVSNPSPTIQFRWSVGLITLRPGRSSTIDFSGQAFGMVLEKLRLVVSSALTTEGGVTPVMTASENLMSTQAVLTPVLCRAMLLTDTGAVIVSLRVNKHHPVFIMANLTGRLISSPASRVAAGCRPRAVRASLHLQ